MDNTIYKSVPIEGFECFKINCEGDLINTNTHHNAVKRSKVQWNRQGYPYVPLQCNGRSYKGFIHRLVALCFVENPNPEEFNIVMHKDDNPANFHYSNLMWGTQKMNMQQSSATGAYSLVKKTVVLRSPEGERVEVVGLRTFCAENNLDWGNFSRMVNGRVQMRGGRPKYTLSVKGWKLYE